MRGRPLFGPCSLRRVMNKKHVSCWGPKLALDNSGSHRHAEESKSKLLRALACTWDCTVYDFSRGITAKRNALCSQLQQWPPMWQVLETRVVSSAHQHKEQLGLLLFWLGHLDEKALDRFARRFLLARS